MLPGGTIGKDKLELAFKNPGKTADLLKQYGDKVHKAVAGVALDGGNLPHVEKAMEDALLKPFKELRNSVYRIEPVIGYWLGAEREAAAIRLILTGHANRIDADTIRQRVGELYAQ